MLREYLFLCIYFGVSFTLAIVIYLLSILFVYISAEEEKNSAYECGFMPFSDSRAKFDVKFYLVGILFIVFDLELVFFFFPWVSIVAKLDFTGYFLILFFGCILMLGFIYEWVYGALDWR